MIELKAEANSKDVEKQLDKLAERMRNRVLKRAMGKALTPVLKIVKQRTPVRSGTTKNAFVKKVRQYTTGVVFGVVGLAGNAVGMFRGKPVRPNNILHLVEGGTKPHQQPRRKVLHPGAKAQPIVTPGRVEIRATALQVFTVEAQKELSALQAKADQ